MSPKARFKLCCAGTAVAAVCCFTPVLVVGLAALGLTAWTGWLDAVLIPMLAVFAALSVWAYVRMKKEAALRGGGENA